MSIKYICLICIILSHVHSSYQQLELAVTIGETLMDVASLGLNVYEIFNKKDSDKIDVDQLVAKFDKLLYQSTNTIITQNWLASKLVKIDDEVRDIHSSMTDLKHLLEATDRDAYARYEEIFTSNYLSQHNTEDLRFLPVLLTNAVPGTSGNILDLYTDYNRCNMSALYEFEQFYYDIISTGISLEIIYNHLKNIPNAVNSTINEWKKNVRYMNETFHSYEIQCKRQYNTLVKDDISDISDTLELNKTLNERYPWMMHDIYDFKPFGTSQFLYYYSKDGHIMKTTRPNGGTRLVIPIDRTKLHGYTQTLSVSKDLLRSSIDTKYDIAAAKHVGEKVSTVVADAELHFAAGIAYFNNNDKFAADRIIIDSESPVQAIFVEDVSLTYCGNGGVKCKGIDREKTAEGRMDVYFYVRNEILMDETPVIGSAPMFVSKSTILEIVLVMSVIAYMIQ